MGGKMEDVHGSQYSPFVAFMFVSFLNRQTSAFSILSIYIFEQGFETVCSWWLQLYFQFDGWHRMFSTTIGAIERRLGREWNPIVFIFTNGFLEVFLM